MDKLDLAKIAELQKDLEAVLATAAEAAEEATRAAITSIITQNVEPGLRDAYKEAFKVYLEGAEVFVAFATSNQKILSIEKGIPSYSIKEKMLVRGRKGVKTSKAGDLYRTVPLPKDLSKGPSGVKGVRNQEVQQEVHEILKNAKFSFKAAFNRGKTYNVVDKSDVGGLLRVREFDSKASYLSGDAPKKTGGVLFRTMSTKPGSASWQHPGFEGKHLLKHIQEWQAENEVLIFNQVVNSLMEMYFQ